MLFVLLLLNNLIITNNLIAY